MRAAEQRAAGRTCPRGGTCLASGARGMAWRVRTEVCEGGWAREGGGGAAAAAADNNAVETTLRQDSAAAGAAVGGRQGNLAALHNRQQQRGSSSSSSSSTGRNSKTAAATSVAIWLRLGRRRVECRRAQRRLDRGNKNSSKGGGARCVASERAGEACDALTPAGCSPRRGVQPEFHIAAQCGAAASMGWHSGVLVMNTT